MNRDYLERISPERQQFVFDMANDEWVDHLDEDDEERMDELSEEMERKTEEFVTTCTDPLELHCFADHWNWDGGVSTLVKIAQNPHCDAATALLIFWRAQPTDYLEYRTRDDVPEYSRDTFDLIELIQTRYMQGAYSSGKITYIPQADFRIPEPIPGQRVMPAVMMDAVIAKP